MVYFTADVCLANEAVEADKPKEEIRQEEYTLPAGFVWETVDIDNPSQVFMYCILCTLV